MSSHEADIKSYFSKTFAEHSETSEGLDYNGRQSHYLRLGVLVNQIDAFENFSVNDVGCGFGSLLDALYGSGRTNFDYMGYDLVGEMTDLGRQTWTSKNPRLEFITGGTDKLKTADYSLASGTFNIKQATPHDDWHEYVLGCLRDMLEHTKVKLVVNFLTSYSDAEYMRDDLYYPDPREMFDFGMKLTGSAAIRHNYGLYDFTLIINKNR